MQILASLAIESGPMRPVESAALSGSHRRTAVEAGFGHGVGETPAKRPRLDDDKAAAAAVQTSPVSEAQRHADAAEELAELSSQFGGEVLVPVSQSVPELLHPVPQRPFGNLSRLLLPREQQPGARVLMQAARPIPRVVETREQQRGKLQQFQANASLPMGRSAANEARRTIERVSECYPGGLDALRDALRGGWASENQAVRDAVERAPVVLTNALFTGLDALIAFEEGLPPADIRVITDFRQALQNEGKPASSLSKETLVLGFISAALRDAGRPSLDELRKLGGDIATNPHLVAVREAFPENSHLRSRCNTVASDLVKRLRDSRDAGQAPAP